MLENWKQYLNEKDYVELVNFVKLTIMSVPQKHKFLVICGGPNTGKDALCNDISKLVESVGFISGLTRRVIDDNRLQCKLLVFDGLGSCTAGIIKEIVSRDKVIYKAPREYPTLIIPKCNVILKTESVDKFDVGLVRRAIVINLTKKFIEPTIGQIYSNFKLECTSELVDF